MSNLNTSNQADCTAYCQTNPPVQKNLEPAPVKTVGQELDAKILGARKHLEGLCIVKAKAEASGLLDFPADFIRQVCWC